MTAVVLTLCSWIAVCSIIEPHVRRIWPDDCTQLERFTISTVTFLILPFFALLSGSPNIMFVISRRDFGDGGDA